MLAPFSRFGLYLKTSGFIKLFNTMGYLSFDALCSFQQVDRVFT